MTTVNVYLTFNGNCEEAMTFYKDIFGTEFSDINRFGEMPTQEGMPPMPEEFKNKIMHVGLPISSETIIMASDYNPMMGGELVVGNNFSLSIQLHDKAEATRLFTALGDGGHVIMPIADTFWNAYFGVLVDKYGITWQVNCTEKN